MSDLRISISAGATLNLGNFESVRVDVSVAGVDPSLDVAEQLAIAEPTIDVVASYVIEQLRNKARNLKASQ